MMLSASLLAVEASAQPPTRSRICSPVAGADTASLASLLGTSPIDEEGTPSYLEWLSDERLQDDLNNLGERLDKFESDLFGTMIDQITHTLIVVHDPTITKTEEQKLRLAVGDTPKGISIEIRPACHSKAQVNALINRFMTGEWVRSVAKPSSADETPFDTPVGIEYRFDIGRVVITIPEASERVAQKGPDLDGLADGARRSFDEGDVTVRRSSIELAAGGRYADYSPHWGGAALNNAGSGPRCTAGFVINVGPTSKRAIVTAGHCGTSARNSGPYLMGTPLAWSNPEDYNTTGSTCQPPNSPPCYDIMVLGDGTMRYDNVIHTGPSAPTTRPVTGAYNPQSWHNICVSGQLTGARCGLSLVASSQGYVCTLPEGTIFEPPGPRLYCVTDAVKATHPTDVVYQLGDSGGPVYVRSGSNAHIVGMGNITLDGRRTVGFHRVSAVLYWTTAVLGWTTTVATTSGPATTW